MLFDLDEILVEGPNSNVIFLAHNGNIAIN